MLAGQLRYWDIASKMFGWFNDIHPDVQYDFFLATWDDSCNDIKWDLISETHTPNYKYDLSAAPFLIDYKLFDMSTFTPNGLYIHYPY